MDKREFENRMESLTDLKRIRLLLSMNTSFLMTAMLLSLVMSMLSSVIILLALSILFKQTFILGFALLILMPDIFILFFSIYFSDNYKNKGEEFLLKYGKNK